VITFSAFSYAYQNVSYALEKTSHSAGDALCGLLPLAFFYAECIIVYNTTWGHNHPALALMLVFPSYCLMTCRHIICSVTKMKFDWVQMNPLWFGLFLVNKAILPIVRKKPSIFKLFSNPETSEAKRSSPSRFRSRKLDCCYRIFSNTLSLLEIRHRNHRSDYHIS